MKKTLILLAIAFLGFNSYAQTSWKVDPYHSSLNFNISHSGISIVNGKFTEYTGALTTTGEALKDANFDFTVDVKSIDTNVNDRDNHLRSADFFEVEKYPKMTFKSSSITSVSKDKYKLSGNLTVHGITKPVTMDLWYRGTIENPQSKAITAGFQLTGTLNRSDFNIGPGFPPPMIGEQVSIKADGEFIKQ